MIDVHKTGIQTLTPPASTPSAGGYWINTDLVLQEAKVTLTAAQLMAMHASPVSVLLAPLAGTDAPPANPNALFVVDSVTIQYKYGGTAFTGGGAINLVYHGTSVVPHSGTVPATILTTAASDFQSLGPYSAGALDLENEVNLGIDITNATAAFTGGNGSLIVTIWYSILRLS